MRKGFTLVELLAVIVILSIIAIITVPMLKGIIEKVKIGALEDSVYGLKSAAELYYSSNGKVETTEFICSDNGCISDADKKLNYKGRVEGRVKLFSDGKVSICIQDGNYSSLLLAEEKKPSTFLGTCEFTKENYDIIELVSATLYKQKEERLNAIVNKLYDIKQISDKTAETGVLTTEIEENYNKALNSSAYDIYLNDKKISYYPEGLYNVSVECDGATGKWNNTFKGVILSNVTSENLKCKVKFTTCNSGNCDTTSVAWKDWLTLLGYDYDNYTGLNDFLTKETIINNCSDIEILYDNTNGAYDYLKNHSSLISEINSTLDFSKCSRTFNYQGVSELYTIPADGVYKLEVWGAQGGSGGGAGGYSMGYKILSKQDNVYVSVGGQGGEQTNGYGYGGYNGGGTGRGNGSSQVGTGGGGATHIATVSGTIANIGLSNLSKIYIIAGGGGGAGNNAYARGRKTSGGTGGGSNGGTGGKSHSSTYADRAINGSGGTQSGAGSGIASGSFGQGASSSDTSGSTGGGQGNAGGGGGLYGGGAGHWSTSSDLDKYAVAGGGGGSGYIGGVPAIPGTDYAPATSNGVRSGNGQAKITLVGIK